MLRLIFKRVQVQVLFISRSLLVTRETTLSSFCRGAYQGITFLSLSPSCGLKTFPLQLEWWMDRMAVEWQCAAAVFTGDKDAGDRCCSVRTLLATSSTL